MRIVVDEGPNGASAIRLIPESPEENARIQSAVQPNYDKKDRHMGMHECLRTDGKAVYYDSSGLHITLADAWWNKDE